MTQDSAPSKRSVKRTRQMSAAQRDSRGKRSDWSRSPYYFTDPAWAHTASEGTRPKAGAR